MKQLIFLTVILFFTCSNISAQARDYAKIKVKSDSIVHSLAEKLELNDQQVEQIKTILFEAKAKEEVLQEHLKMMEKTIKEQIQTSETETDTKIDAILTEKQRKALAKERKKNTL